MDNMANTMQRARAAVADSGSLPVCLIRGAVGGVAAGVVFAVVTMWFVDSLGDPARMPLLMIAAMVQGEEALMNETASPVVGALVHMVLSAMFGLAFAALTLRMRTNAAVAIVGAVYGVLLYLVNFKVVSPLLFPWFGDANQPFELTIHVVFGALLAYALFNVGARAPAEAKA